MQAEYRMMKYEPKQIPNQLNQQSSQPEVRRTSLNQRAEGERLNFLNFFNSLN